MRKFALAFSAVALLTVPALAGSPSTRDKPIVVAENLGVEVRVGDRNRDRDVRRNHRNERVVIVGNRHRDRDWDRRRHYHD